MKINIDAERNMARDIEAARKRAEVDAMLAAFKVNPKAVDGADLFSRYVATNSLFVVCGQCGNKRCPGAQSAAFECSDSNEPNQPPGQLGGWTE